MRDSYYITFEAEKVDENGGHLVRKTTFEGHVRSGIHERKVYGMRTIKPYTKWYRGKLWVPLPGLVPDPKSYSDERSRNFVRARMALLAQFDERDPLVPPERHGSDSRTLYKPHENTDEEGIITPGTGLVNLELGKLSDSDMCILNDCATLAMQDNLIQTGNMEWRNWRVLKIEARREGLGVVHGYNYHLTFQAKHSDPERTSVKLGDLDRTLEAEVWDGIAQRQVKRFRVTSPCTTNWYPGNLWIPV